MPSVSPIKLSPIAKYIVENKAKAYKKNGYVELRNAENKLIGRLTKGEAPLGQYRYVNIDLYRANNENLFMSRRTEIETTYRYFLKEHKFMPVKIEIENTVCDFENNTKKRDVLTKGLASNIYIDKLKESEELKTERQKLGKNIPDNFPMYEINKPFKYEFKSHLYYKDIPIDSTKPIIKE